MGTYSDYEQRLLDQQTGEEMDRLAQRREARDTIATAPIGTAHVFADADNNGLNARVLPEAKTSNLQVCEGELKLISEHGQPHGIRDRGGYLLFFPPVRKYEGQEERYRNELAQSFRLADFLLQSLKSSHETGVPRQLGWARLFPNGVFDVFHDRPRAAERGETWTVVPLFASPAVKTNGDVDDTPEHLRKQGYRSGKSP